METNEELMNIKKAPAFLGVSLPIKQSFPKPDGTYEEDETTRSGTEFQPPEKIVTELMLRINTLEERFDKLIEAIDKSKRVRNI